MTLTHTLFVLGICIIAALATYAIHINVKLFKRRKEIEEVQRQAEDTKKQKIAKMRSDLVFIARAYLAEQVELPEASLRIQKLAQKLSFEPNKEDHFRAFDEIANDIADIPTHEAWRALDKKTRIRFQKQLSTLSTQRRDETRSAAEKIIQVLEEKLH